MKVFQVMQKKVVFVTPQTSVLDAAHLIFGRRHMGLSVCAGRGRTLVGFITDQDILSQCFPSMKEYVEDVVHARDFDGMEGKLKEIMQMKVKDVMNTNVVSIEKEASLLKAESTMKVKDVARLPVVNATGNMIGILTKRDIFRALVGRYM
jgi:CBS domain-containing protein